MFWLEINFYKESFLIEFKFCKELLWLEINFYKEIFLMWSLNLNLKNCFVGLFYRKDFNFCKVLFFVRIYYHFLTGLIFIKNYFRWILKFVKNYFGRLFLSEKCMFSINKFIFYEYLMYEILKFTSIKAFLFQIMIRYNVSLTSKDEGK